MCLSLQGNLLKLVYNYSLTIVPFQYLIKCCCNSNADNLLNKGINNKRITKNSSTHKKATLQLQGAVNIQVLA